jgi:hypothetical protein
MTGAGVAGSYKLFEFNAAQVLIAPIRSCIFEYEHL